MPSSGKTIELTFEREVPAVLSWRSWPLVDHARWSWLVPLGVLAVGALAVTLSGSWLMGMFAVVVVTLSMWQFWLPVTFEIDSQGLRRWALGRPRLVPWAAVRAYQPRATGIVLFQRPDPLPIDALRAIFVPYADDEDETLCAVRQYLPLAVELPE